MQTINGLKYQIDQAQIDVHRQQQQISDSLPPPDTLFGNMCGSPPKLNLQEGPKIEVSSLATAIKTEGPAAAGKDNSQAQAAAENQAKKQSTREPSTCPSDDKLKESTKDVEKEETSADEAIQSKCLEKPTPTGARVTPAGPTTKKPNVKKVSRSSKSIKKVKKR